MVASAVTVALTLKVNDGIVLSADSASTLTSGAGGTASVVNVYNNANKTFNLRKGFPIGMVKGGLGQISKTPDRNACQGSAPPVLG